MKSLMIAATIGIFAGLAMPANAQSTRQEPAYTRVCLNTYAGAAPITICMYETLAQCEASKVQQIDSCMINPAFVPRR